MPTFWRVFIISEHRILSKAFFASIEMIVWFLFFNLLMCITLIDLWILKNLCIPGINPTWSWYMILSMYCSIQTASILLRIFAGVLYDVYFGLEQIRKCYLGHILEMMLFLKCLMRVSRFKSDNPRYSNCVVRQKPSSVLSHGIRIRYVILRFLWSLSETYTTLWWAAVLV